MYVKSTHECRERQAESTYFYTLYQLTPHLLDDILDALEIFSVIQCGFHA